MLVAVIGNMNNNGFALMRYLRDLGADAHLFLYANDGCGSLSHFRPECDTWEIERWSNYIHQTDILNLPLTAVCFPCRLKEILYYSNDDRPSMSSEKTQKPKSRGTFNIGTLAIMRATGLMFRSLIAIKSYFKLSQNKLPLKVLFLTLWRMLFFNSYRFYNQFDAYIGSGIAPALMEKVSIKLDIYYPYCVGIEFVGGFDDSLAVNESSGRRRKRLIAAREIQIQGIRNAKHCLSADESLTKEVFDSINVNYLPITLPMIYNLEDKNKVKMSSTLKCTLTYMNKYDFKIISHSRHLWFNPGKYSQEDWERNSKHNDWLIREYASFVKLRPNLNSLLVLFEYGSDVNHSKELCKELSLDNQVCWLKMMERREIMELIGNCDIGVGEFYTDQGIIWGGTGWEVMAVGKPLLQGFNFKEAEFEEIYGYLPPPMLPVIVQTDICKHLVDMADNPNRAKIIGQEAREWFNTYNGIGLAQQWLKLLNED